MNRLDASAGRDQGGFTLIEMVVSMLLLSIGVFGLMQVFYGSLRVTLTADARTRATAVASREIENMRSVPYAAVGMDGSLLGGLTTYTDSDGHSYTYVTGGPVVRTDTQTTSGTVISIQRAVVWVAVGANAHAYKRVIAVAGWTDTSGTHAVRQDSEVYPGGLGSSSSSTSTSTTSTTVAAPSTPGAPTALTATTDGANPTTAINLSWTPGTPVGTTWEIDHSLDSHFLSSVTVDTTTQPAGQTTFQKTGLASATTFYFRVRALTANNNSSWSPYASAVTQAPPSAVCTIGTANITPAFTNRSNSGNTNIDYPSAGLYVSIHTSGTCSGLTLRYTPLSTPIVSTLVNEQGGVWDYSIRSTTGGWNVGISDITVLDGTNTVLAHIPFTVCADHASSCP